MPTVLLIEGVKLWEGKYEMGLRDAGYTVRRATHGHAGYELAVSQRPDVIVTDLMLPDVDGWTVCAMLRANPATAAIPLVILTARNDHDIPATADITNVAAFLHKPYPIAQAIAAIDEALGGRPHRV